MTAALLEANFDGLVGPTHNYAGLSYGNVASTGNVGSTSRPRAAALQGLAKMRRLMSLGVPQGVLPPQERPHLPTLRRLGFTGSDSGVIGNVYKTDPVLLAQVCSASCMWTANAATVAPAPDTADGRTHMLTANLVSMLHRSIEPPTTARVLRAIFRDEARFEVHDALPACPATGDEGAANHTRLFDDTGSSSPATHVFVYGASWNNRAAPRPARFPARQTLEASQAAARLLGLGTGPARSVFLQQAPATIDAGVFHNDVIGVGSGRVFFHHQDAYADAPAAMQAVRDALPALVPVCVGRDEASVADAVSSYLFNSQLLALAPDRYVLIAPSEAQENPRIKAAVDRVVADKSNPITEVTYMDVRESMRNGGGPACLRLRVALSRDDLARVTSGCLMNESKIAALEAWATRHYREELTPADLADPSLLRESRSALDELTRLLGIGDVYEFQRA